MFGDNKAKIHSAPINRYKSLLSKEIIIRIEQYLFNELKNLNYEINYACNALKLPVIYRIKNNVIWNYFKNKFGSVLYKLKILISI